MKKLLPLIFLPFAFLDLQGQKGDLEKLGVGYFAIRHQSIHSKVFIENISHELGKSLKSNFNIGDPNPTELNIAQTQNYPKRKLKEDKSPSLYYDELSNSIVTKPYLRIAVSGSGDFLTAQFPRQSGLISIYNMQNKLIYASKTDESGEIKVDISALEMGTYIITFSNGKEFQAAKFVKTF